MNFPNKNDYDLCKDLIENQDFLLSSSLNENEFDVDFFSLIQSNNTESNLQQQANQFNKLNTNVFQLSDEKSLPPHDQLGLNDEIIDANLFELLRSEDPDVVSLLESIGSSELKASYLPQISINTTSRVLEQVQSDDFIKQKSVDAELEVCNLLGINKIKNENDFSESQLASVPNTTSSRVSQRLIKKRINGELKSYTKDATRMMTKKENKKINLKRKRSVDEEPDENASLFSNENSSDKHFKSVDNSVGYESDEHIYFNDDDDDNDDSNNATKKASTFDSYERNLDIKDEDSNDREFRQFVQNYNSNQSLMDKGNKSFDPNKKDANKEAATRYRLKKLSEKDQLFETRMLLEKENDEVKRRCELVQTEINYLKNLLVQMLLTKGVLGNTMSHK